MKVFKKSFVLLCLVSVLFVKCNCNKDDKPTPATSLVEQLSRDWVLTSALKSGKDAGFNISGFLLTLRESNGEASSFQIKQGGVPVSPSPYTNQGNWKLINSNTQIIFGVGTTKEFKVSIVGTPSNETLTVKWVDPNDKTNPEYTFKFEPK